ncbi:MAG: hypothetical protein ACK4NC_01790 [Candidatus Gracilibacteria bacterium]
MAKRKSYIVPGQDASQVFDRTKKGILKEKNPETTTITEGFIIKSQKDLKPPVVRHTGPLFLKK